MSDPYPLDPPATAPGPLAGRGILVTRPARQAGGLAAKLSALGCLEAVHSLVGLDNVVRAVKVLGMVNTAPGFNNTPGCIHGASDLLLEVFGENGRHARSAVGMQIPGDLAVEVEIIFEVK